MIDVNSYVVNIPLKSCKNCKYCNYDNVFKSLVCDANDGGTMPTPVHENGLCDNFKSNDAVIKSGSNNEK